MNLTKPNTLGELQLYKVLQRANLLSYYENFISQGGDDVQQLCEAGEEEFLEIMALVGMACKPLHVRRLQKALQEWVTRPAIFRGTNIHYLPAQSVSLTSLGIDTRDLLVPSNQPISTSPGTPNGSGLPAQEEDLLNRPLSVGGSAMTTPVKSINGIESVFRMDNSSRTVNSTTNNLESNYGLEKSDEGTSSVALDQILQKFVKTLPTAFEKKELVKQLKIDRIHRELAIAIEDDNRHILENLLQEFVNNSRSSDNVTGSRHEDIVNDAAVKLCLADERFLLKKNELFATAEKIAIEVQSKLPSRHRSSTYLHGSSSPSRMQEVNNRLQNIKSQRACLHQKLAEAQNNKNVIKENECQNILTRIKREEVLLFQEKNELDEKLMNESKEATSTHGEQSSSFSTEMADLAKAHNLSFGNIQSLPSASHWPSRDNFSESSSHNGLNKDSNTRRSSTRLSPNHAPGLSPPIMVSIDFKGKESRGTERIPPVLNRVKVEDTLNEAPGFPSNGTNIFRGSKRKHASGSPNGTETISTKKVFGSGTNSE